MHVNEFKINPGMEEYINALSKDFPTSEKVV